MKKISIWAGTGVLMLTVGLVSISYAKDQTAGKAPHGETDDKSKKSEQADNAVVARVNGTGITMRELISEMNKIGPSLVKEPSQRTPAIDKKVKETALDILIFKELAVQEAVRQGMRAMPSAVEEARKQLKQNLGSEDNYRDYLQKMDLTEESLGDLLKKDILFTQITEKEIFKKAKPNDKKAIEKRKKQWEAGLKKKAKIVILQ